YVELDYCTPQVSEITEIEAFLINIDPNSSRGTRLAVME
ncbi:MAG: hypothetical protein QG594_1092, partial [Bacteroidota bacterium]|nr:hypothetical protein [Bacteroidota bacterium]